MKINTQRLEIVALTSKQLDMWCNNIGDLENEFNCTYEGEPIEGVFLDIVSNQITICKNDERNCCWHSFWLIIRKSDRVVVGSCGFKNIPNMSKEVEIGYGLGNTHEHKGYMTECVKEVSLWALKQDEVQSVIAQTERGNLLSENVLLRCGFAQYKIVDENKWWRLCF